MSRTRPTAPDPVVRAQALLRFPRMTVGNCVRTMVTVAVTGLWAVWLAPMTIPVLLAPVPILAHSEGYWLATTAVGGLIFIGWSWLTSPLPSIELELEVDDDPTVSPSPYQPTTSRTLYAEIEKGTAA